MSRQGSVRVARQIRAQQRADRTLVQLKALLAEYNGIIETINELDPLEIHPSLELSQVWDSPKD